MLVSYFCISHVSEKTKLTYEGIRSLLQNCTWDPKASGCGVGLWNTDHAHLAPSFHASQYRILVRFRLASLCRWDVDFSQVSSDSSTSFHLSTLWCISLFPVVAAECSVRDSSAMTQHSMRLHCPPSLPSSSWRPNVLIYFQQGSIKSQSFGYQTCHTWRESLQNWRTKQVFQAGSRASSQLS